MALFSGLNTKAGLFLHKDAIAKGWIEEPKSVATFVVTAPWMRYQCDIVQGKAKKPDPTLALKINAELEAFYATDRYRKAKKHADRAFELTRYAMALGHISDLVDPRTSPQQVRIWALSYVIGFAVAKQMPGLDLELSDLPNLSAVYRAPGLEVPVRGFKDSENIITAIWGCQVLISEYPGLPEAVWIRPVAVAEQHVDQAALAELAQMPALEGISIGTSLMTRGKEIAWRYDEDEDVWHLLIIGQTRCRKSTLAKNICFQALRSKEHVSDIIWLDGDMGAPGMRKLTDLGVTLANTPEAFAAQLHRITEIQEERNAIMQANDWDKWEGPRVIIVLDEVQKSFARGDVDKKAIALLPTTVAKYGMWIVAISPKTTDKEGPAVFWGAFQWRIMMKMDEERPAGDVFHRDKASFDFHPVNMKPGQFVMRRPGASDLEYGTIHKPMIKTS